jgi:endonuclease-3
VPAAVEEILRRLSTVFGEPRWRPHQDPISELILTILSQHTSDRLSGQAFARLLQRFPDWEAVRQAPVEEIQASIARGGLSRTKAPRIKAVLTRVIEAHGSYDLAFLADMPLNDAKQWLLALPGVGPKTAACVLMFALGRPALPVDTHVFRVSQRLGLLPATMSAERAHEHLERLVPEKAIYAFHISLIKHGRYTCTAQRPRCERCVLSDICPAAFVFQRPR